MLSFLKKMFSNNEIVLPIFPEPEIWITLDGFLETKNIEGLFLAYSNGTKVERADIIRYLDIINNYEAINLYCADHSNNYFSHLIQGIIHNKKAKQSRGAQSANNTTEVQFRGMQEFANIAINNLQNALEINDQDSHVYTELMTPLLHLSAYKEDFIENFEKAKVLNEDNFRLYCTTLNALTEKWGGSHADMFNIAQQASEQSELGDAKHAVVALAHAERWLYFGMSDDYKGQKIYFRQKSVQRKIINAYLKFIDGRSSANIRSNYMASNFFAFCFYMMDDADNLAQEFRYLEQSIEFDAIPWCYWVDNKFETFHDIKQVVRRAA